MKKLENTYQMGYYQFIDTQIVSYAFKENNTSIMCGNAISSIVASEFLLLQGSDPLKANYYIPRIFSNGWCTRTDHPFNKRLTDYIVTDFNGDFGPIIEYSNITLASIINNKAYRGFCISIQFLKKDVQKVLKKRLQFLIDSRLKCMPLSEKAVNLALILLREFMGKHNVKRNFRNSWNDMLILATALDFGASLCTKDDELSKFIIEKYIQSVEQVDPFVRLVFDKTKISPQLSSRESKGYINRSWKARFYYYK